MQDGRWKTGRFRRSALPLHALTRMSLLMIILCTAGAGGEEHWLGTDDASSLEAPLCIDVLPNVAVPELIAGLFAMPSRDARPAVLHDAALLDQPWTRRGAFVERFGRFAAQPVQVH